MSAFSRITNKFVCATALLIEGKKVKQISRVINRFLKNSIQLNIFIETKILKPTYGNNHKIKSYKQKK